jgi:diadenosine tetraphosphate (Ap4A) HIT family hydrolase
MSDWQLDPRLAADSELLAVCEDIEVRAMTAAPWPWLILVPRVCGAVELFDLAPVERVRLLNLICRLGQRLRAEFAAIKINVAALGNIVRQLHVHVIARHEGDPGWPGPVWGRAEPYLGEVERAERRRRLRAVASD